MKLNLYPEPFCRLIDMLLCLNDKGFNCCLSIRNTQQGKKVWLYQDLNATMVTRGFSHCLNRAEGYFQNTIEGALKNAYTTYAFCA
jgi:hypothetical protein